MALRVYLLSRWCDVCVVKFALVCLVKVKETASDLQKCDVDLIPGKYCNAEFGRQLALQTDIGLVH